MTHDTVIRHLPSSADRPTRNTQQPILEDSYIPVRPVSIKAPAEQLNWFCRFPGYGANRCS